MKLTPFSEGCGVLVEDVQLAELTDAEVEALRTEFEHLIETMLSE